MSVHKNYFFYDIIPLKIHDLVSNQWLGSSCQVTCLQYKQYYPIKNTFRYHNIYLKFTEKIPSICNILTLEFCDHFKNRTGHQISLISSMCILGPKTNEIMSFCGKEKQSVEGRVTQINSVP